MQVNVLTDATNILAFKEMLKGIDDSKQNIIIVPDKFSLSAEKLFFEQKKLFVNFSTRIFSFTKLASLILEEVLVDKKILDKNQSLMIISSIIQENNDKFKYFKNIKDIKRISEDIFKVISQMLSSNVNELKESNNSVLNDKSYDINLILKIYLDKRKDCLIDANFKYDLFLNEIKNSIYIKNSNVYIGMFNSFTTQVKNIIKEICKYSLSTTFAVSKTDNRVNNNEIFDFCKNINTNAKITNLNSPMSAHARFMLNNFFTSKKEKFNFVDDALVVYEAKNVKEEIENIAMKIKQDVLFNNYRYKDISVCVSNGNEYFNDIRKIFNLYNINYFIDENITLKDTSYARFYLDFINLIQDFNMNNLLIVLKSFYIDFDEKIKNDFERFVKRYSINEIGKNADFSILKDDINYSSFELILNNFAYKILNFKDKIVNINIYDFFIIFDGLLDEFNCVKRLNDKIDELFSKNILKFKQYTQIEEKIKSVKENICEFYAEEFKLEKLSYFLKLCFENTTISVPPPSVDSVFVGEVQGSYFIDCKKLYIIGANSANFPCLKKDVNLFLDNEFKLIEGENKIEPKNEDVNRRNYYLCFQTMLNCEKLIMSYSLTGNDGSRYFPSIFINNCLTKFKFNNEDLQTIKINYNVLSSLTDEEIMLLTATKNPSLEEIIRNYFKVDDEKIKAILYKIITENFNYQFELSKTNLINENYCCLPYYSSSSLENYFSCPKKFLFANILKLKEDEKKELNALFVGRIIHSCVEFLSRAIVSKKEIDNTIKNSIIDFVFNKKDNNFIKILKYNSQIIKNLKEEVLALFDFILSQQSKSGFKISKYEFPFKDNLIGINFKGYVDRVDENEDSFIIVDYKTGSTTMDYESIISLHKIQLILYAKIIEKELNKKCAGVYYLNLNDDFSKKQKPKFILTGITVNENNNIHKLDEDTAEGKSEFFDFKDKYLLTRNQFENLTNYILKNIEKINKEILKGEFKERPQGKGKMIDCDYCPYKEICSKKEVNEKEFNDEVLKGILDD